MTARMSRESAQHITAEMQHQGVTSNGLIALFVNRGFDALGYRNWSEFVERELRTALDRLSDSEKAELAVSMRTAGCSLRGTAAAVGWSHTTVKNRTGYTPNASSAGTDGLRYRQPRSRKNYASSVLDAAWDFRNAAEKLDDLIFDERFENVRDDLADQLISHLLVAYKSSDRHLNHLGKAPTS